MYIIKKKPCNTFPDVHYAKKSRSNMKKLKQYLLKILEICVRGINIIFDNIIKVYKRCEINTSLLDRLRLLLCHFIKASLTIHRLSVFSQNIEIHQCNVKFI